MLKQVRSKARDNAERFFSSCDKISKNNYFTNVYGLGRSLLAFGTLISLLNSKYTIFPEHILTFYEENQNKILYGINLFEIIDFEYLLIAQIIAILILIVVILGWYPRITGILHWWVSYSYFISAGLPEGGDKITAIITLLLIPITLLDNRKNHWKISSNKNGYKNFIAFCFFLLIQIQMAVIYLHAATEKMYKIDLWINGTAIYYWVNDNVFGISEWLSFFMNPLINSPTILSLVTWGVVIFELTLFGAFFMSKRNKRKILKYAVLFHFLILLFHGLVSFFFAMFGGLILYLFPKERMIFKYGFKKKATKVYGA